MLKNKNNLKLKYFQPTAAVLLSCKTALINELLPLERYPITVIVTSDPSSNAQKKDRISYNKES